MASGIPAAPSTSDAPSSGSRTPSKNEDQHRLMIEQSREAINQSRRLLRWISDDDLTGGIFPIDVDYLSVYRHSLR
jgi:hypothetical protein